MGVKCGGQMWGSNVGVKNTIKYKPYDTFILEEEPIEIALG